jgi:hypothetical protein
MKPALLPCPVIHSHSSPFSGIFGFIPIEFFCSIPFAIPHSFVDHLAFPQANPIGSRQTAGGEIAFCFLDPNESAARNNKQKNGSWIEGGNDHQIGGEEE